MPRFECPYCGNEALSPNGTGSDISCCGEVGHAVEVVEREEHDVHNCLVYQSEGFCEECRLHWVDEEADIATRGGY